MALSGCPLALNALKPDAIHGLVCNAAMQAVGGALRLLGGSVLARAALDAALEVLCAVGGYALESCG